MMKCEEAAIFVSESKDRRLPWHLKARLRFHLALCALCRRYERNLEMLSRISAAAGRMLELGQLPGGEPLPAEAKARIKQRLSDPKS